MGLTAQQRRFAEAYLVGPNAPSASRGRDNPAEGGHPALMKAASESRKIWVEAKDSVDAGIERLVARLAKESDPELGEIAGAIRDLASAGLPGISDGAQTELLSGIMELEGGAPAAASLAKSLAALQRYRAALSGNPFIEICEENPFGVNVPITATMTGALDEMEKRLSAA